jgi:hypothetical protein
VEKQAGEQLGETVVAGSLISTSGTGKAMGMNQLGSQLAGVVGAAAGAAVSMAGSRTQTITTPGGYQGLMYLAVGATNVGFFKVKQGFVGPSLKELLLVVPRASIEQFEMSGGKLTCPLTVALSDGTVFPLEVPRAYKGKVEKIGEMLRAR